MPRFHDAQDRRAPRVAGLLPLLFACTIFAPRAHAAPASAAAPPWSLMVGDVVRDTLDVPLARALEAGRWVLAHDQWSLEPCDSLAPRLVTRWKPVHYPLMKLVTGDARVRVAVSMRALSAARTEIVVQGGVATEANLAGSPVLALARAAGTHECKGYVVEVRARLGDDVAHLEPATAAAAAPR